MDEIDEIPEFEVQAGKKRSFKKLLIALVVFVVLGGTFLGIGAYLNRANVKVEKKSDTSNQKPPEQVSEASKTSVPALFKKVSLAGIIINYPESWGEPVEKQATQEKVATEGDANRVGSFEGEYAKWAVKNDKPNDWIITVNSKDSYLKDLSFNGDWPTKNVMAYLDKVYNDKKIDPEEIYSYPQSAFLPPQISSYINAYNPRYAESSNGKWRGYWYVAGTGNGTIANLGFRALVFNKTMGKVVSISGGLDSAKYDELWKGKEVNDKLKSEIEKYFQTAYIKDTEVNRKIDEEYLKVIKYLQ